MNRNLDLVERTLRNLVEKTVARLFPQDFSGMQAAAQIVDAIQETFARQGAFTPPYRVVFSFPPDMYDALPNRQAVVEFAQNALLELEETLQQKTGVIPQVVLRRAAETPSNRIQMEYLLENAATDQTVNLRSQPAPLAPAQITNPAYLIISGEQVFSLTHKITNIGRAPENELVLNHPLVSRRHAQIRWSSNHYTIFDLGSRAGTLVNGRLVQQQQLIPGDVVAIAGVSMIFGQENQGEWGETRPNAPGVTIV